MSNRVQNFVKSMSQRDGSSEAADAVQAADPPAGELLDPSVLSSIGGMDFVSRVVVDLSLIHI